MERLEVPRLVGRLVRLEPLADSHVEPLIAAATEERSTFGYTSVPATAAELEAQVERLLHERAAGESIPFAQVRAETSEPVGMTRYLTLRWREGALTPYAIEIGGTWLAASAQRTGINVEAKLLLMAHAFDVWEVGRVDFKTDARNERSRTALEALGATFEGVLRNWQPSHAVGEEQALRDSAMFSVTTDDWPAVREHLAARLR